MSTERHTSVWVGNPTDYYFQVRAKHMYTSDGTVDSGWTILKPRGKCQVFESINFWTGPLAWGQDYWKLIVVKLVETGDGDESNYVVDGKQLRIDSAYMTQNGKWFDLALSPPDEGRPMTINLEFPNAIYDIAATKYFNVLSEY
ncbi:unnamed protein product [Caenorhabditis sp. 36 PRJEB53466]|nr:unnamed protein product [Caenorhabditis sp. 36 PRJEB53466]